MKTQWVKNWKINLKRPKKCPLCLKDRVILRDLPLEMLKRFKITTERMICLSKRKLRSLITISTLEWRNKNRGLLMGKLSLMMLLALEGWQTIIEISYLGHRTVWIIEIRLLNNTWAIQLEQIVSKWFKFVPKSKNPKHN